MPVSSCTALKHLSLPCLYYYQLLRLWVICPQAASQTSRWHHFSLLTGVMSNDGLSGRHLWRRRLRGNGADRGGGGRRLPWLAPSRESPWLNYRLPSAPRRASPQFGVASVAHLGRAAARAARRYRARAVTPWRAVTLWRRPKARLGDWGDPARPGQDQGWNSQFCFWSQRIYNGGRICYISYVFMVPY